MLFRREVLQAQLGDLGPCCGDGSGSADHKDDLAQHLKSYSAVKVAGASLLCKEALAPDTPS